jgi:glycerol-3-phosphate acyltransferase PlsX
MIIAVDLMGGDRAPGQILEGAVDFAESNPYAELILVGDKKLIAAEPAFAGREERLKIHNASQVIGMDEDLVSVLRKKSDSSIMAAFRLLREGRADAVVSAGNSKATVAACLHTMGMIPGIRRPALISHFP